MSAAARAHAAAQRCRALVPAALLVLPCVVRWTERSRAGGFQHIFLPQECAALVSAALLLGWAALTKLSFPRTKGTAIVCVLLGLGMLSTLASPNPWLGLRVLSLSAAGAAFFIVGSAVGRVSALSMLPIWLLGASVMLEATGAVPGLSARGHVPGGLLGERNLAAELLVCSLPLFAHFALVGRRWQQAAALTGSLVTVCAVVCTRTRSAWIALLLLGLGGIVLGLRARPRGALRLRMLLLAGCLLIGASAAPLVSQLHWRARAPMTDTLTHLVDVDSASGHGRLIQYQTTLRMAAAHPALGVGPGNWAGQYLSFAAADDPTLSRGLWPTTRLPNSDVLGFVAERGVLAVGLALWLLVLLAQRGDHALLRRATLLTVLVVGSLDAVLQLPAPLLWIAWLFGTSSSAAATTRTDRPAPRAFASLAFALLALSLLALGRLQAFRIALHPFGVSQLELASRLDPGDLALRLRTANDWVESGRCDLAARHLVAVERAAPRHPVLEPLRARCAEHAGAD